MMFDDCKCYAIVIANNEASNYYHEYCKPSWQSIGLTINKFHAITPKMIKSCCPLTFAKYSSAAKYISRKIKAPITDTEKAVWCSHFLLWAECFYTRTPLFILEHDSLLIDNNKIWRENDYGMIFYDKAAMGSYLLQPWFAEILVNHALDTTISGGPYSFVAEVAAKTNNLNKVVNDMHERFTPASNQVMSNKYGNTIQHYSNMHPELFSDKFFHKFILIE